MSTVAAYEAAYPAVRPGSARTAGARLLHDVRIRARVEELRAGLAERALLTREMVLNGLLALAQDAAVPPGVRRHAWRDLGEHLALFRLVVDHGMVSSLAEQLGLDPAEVEAEAEAILRGSR